MGKKGDNSGILHVLNAGDKSGIIMKCMEIGIGFSLHVDELGSDG